MKLCFYYIFKRGEEKENMVRRRDGVFEKRVKLYFPRILKLCREQEKL